MEKTYNIRITGLVQGVGFRPFIYRIATHHQLRGTVENRNDGVKILVQGKNRNVEDFLIKLKTESPPASFIQSLEVAKKDFKPFKDFRILKSKNLSKDITLVSPDIAVCSDCLKDMQTQPHRIDYPFINCTNCGPRFTIIRDLPYDRPQTTMNEFRMCQRCDNEYHDVGDRRFHAQPIACNYCGPEYSLYLEGKEITGLSKILAVMEVMLNNGKVIAIKGLGGFFLACDALNSEAVNRLRKIKIREGKPFAVMFRDIEAVRKYAFVDEYEVGKITSWQRPIVLLKTRSELVPGVSMGFPTTGAMLPYMPFHYLLFEKIGLEALVLTSGNLADEPIVIENEKALDIFLPGCDAVLTYNRAVHNRVDDSVTMLVNGKERPLRRSRGYVPAPVYLDMDVEGIVAVGAELVNCFCVGKGKQAILSQHIGDLKNLETYEFFLESFNRFKKLFRVEPKLIVCDMHPEYLSTKFALQTGLPVFTVQHHHAHIASCMAEHGLDTQVIGVSFDGIGLGDDGNIWGGEFLVCDLSDYQRVVHFDYHPMPGGDQATLNPWRMAVSYLYSIFGHDLHALNLPFMKDLDPGMLKIIVQMIEKNVNCPQTSSAGRLFDAVSALTGICTVSTFHAEAPMRLEAAINSQSDESYDFVYNKTISVTPMIRQIVNDLQRSLPASYIAIKFHNTIVNIIYEVVTGLKSMFNINKVVLSGGTFQNRYILEKIEKKLERSGFQLYLHEKVPCNDGGIALGQIAIAAKKLKTGVVP